MKKTNKKGFTLIELIVVATIMVMIMGAILNWIRPMNKFYDRTRSLADSNDIGSLLMDSVDDELRYCSNVLILQDYQGLPDVVNGFLVNSSGKTSSTAKFTDVLIIDNNNIRGELLDNFDPNGTVAHRKGARGCILHAFIPEDSGTIDVSRLKFIGQGGEALYGEYGCNFVASLNKLENDSKCVTIDMTVSRPRRNGATYEFDQFGYDQTRDFELVNLNVLNNKALNADFYTATGEGKAIDYNMFVQTSSSNDLLNSGTYTYIFYTKLIPDAKKVKVTLVDDKGKQLGSSIQKDFGTSLNSTEIDSLWQWAEPADKTFSPDPNTPGKYRKWKLDGIVDVETNKDYKTYATEGITADLQLQAKYSWQYRDASKYAITFYDRFDDGKVDTNDPKGYPRQQEFWPVGTDEFADGTCFYDYPGNGDKDGKFKFIGWYNAPVGPGTAPSGDEAADRALGWFVSGAQYSASETEFYAIYKEIPTAKLNFSLNGGSGGSLNLDLGTQIGDISNNSTYQQMEEQAKQDAGDNERFSHFDLYDGEENKGDVTKINPSELDENGEYTIQPVYVEDSHPGMYEVTLHLGDELSSWFALQIGNPEGQQGQTTIAVYEETDTGTEEIQSTIAIYSLQISHSFSPNSVIKIYADRPISIRTGGKNQVASGACTLVYEYSNWTETLSKS